MRYVFMCRSLTYAQSAARVLEKNAISASVKKAPTGLSGSGCSYSVSVSYMKGTAAAGVLAPRGTFAGQGVPAA